MLSRRDRRARLLDEMKFADCTLVCRGVAFKADRTIICLGSAYFEGMFGKEFQEAADAKANIDEDPALFARLLQYLYTAEYKGLPDMLPCLFGSKILSLVNDTYESVEKSLLLHAKMYSLAEGFMMDDLKDTARRAFSKFYFGDWTTIPQRGMFTEDDLEYLSEIYNGTATSDRGLRDLVVLGIQDSLWSAVSLPMEGVNNCISRLPDLAVDLISKPLLRSDYICNGCKVVQRVIKLVCSCETQYRCGQTPCMTNLRRTTCRHCFEQGMMIDNNTGSDWN